MSRSKEQQIEAAIDEHFHAASCQHWQTAINLREMCTKLLSGHYSEEPLPPITHPGKAWGEVNVKNWVECRDNKFIDKYRVVAFAKTSLDDYPDLKGPLRDTKARAIEAWNAGLERP